MILMKDIVREGAQVLRDKAVEVNMPVDEETKNELKLMMEYLHNSVDEALADKYKLRAGVGLAAPQVGISKRMFVISITDGEKVVFEACFINPKIISYSDECAYLAGGEGCLSVDRKVKGYVYRPRRTKVQCLMYDIEKDTVEEKVIVLKDYLSIVFNHEFDHLNGILFVDRINKKDPFYIKPNSIEI